MNRPPSRLFLPALVLIGAVVAEFAAGAAGRETGLASRILEASFRTEIPKMYAALLTWTRRRSPRPRS